MFMHFSLKRPSARAFNVPGAVLILVLRVGGDIVPDLREVRYLPEQSSALEPNVGAVRENLSEEVAPEALKAFLHNHSCGQGV